MHPPAPELELDEAPLLEDEVLLDDAPPAPLEDEAAVLADDVLVEEAEWLDVDALELLVVLPFDELAPPAPVACTS